MQKNRFIFFIRNHPATTVRLGRRRSRWTGASSSRENRTRNVCSGVARTVEPVDVEFKIRPFLDDPQSPRERLYSRVHYIMDMLGFNIAESLETPSDKAQVQAALTAPSFIFLFYLDGFRGVYRRTVDGGNERGRT